ncbi:NAD-dependent epimerase/dehydratase family protein [Cryptosporangium arvum]|uniref:Nucleoside-diphosphate-sugar epimerase n=1 Tax=Cryptosporangium arvum DSM 44712 TaxID=927661 RepID=A0A010ZXW2_9ACTN|nr:NAD-dependent epimerase/dehydratase family protein [Cryptosporangium arvum]EXG82057.1 nucleoside-diphosphate-sugar epimerase [Cryptosporangium arvum DSM 44712]
MAQVLVTGGSGFVGAHTVVRLIDAGHSVRTTVRSLRRVDDVRAMVARPGAALTFVEADLAADTGWARAVDGCEYVLHVASPFPAGEPSDADEVIAPARDGALRVLRAAHAAGTRRTVLTSSFAAIGYGTTLTRPYDESDWTDPTDDLPAYIRSKAIAERAAWDYAAAAGVELAVINPTGIFGPILGPDYSTSIGLVQAMLNGAMPTVPRASFGVVDVRDVADAHIRAMTAPDAAGKRFLCTSEATDDPFAGAQCSYLEIAHILRRRFPERADRLPAGEAPGPEAPAKAYRIERIRTVLGWKPRSAEEAVVATAKSLLALAV